MQIYSEVIEYTVVRQGGITKGTTTTNQPTNQPMHLAHMLAKNTLQNIPQTSRPLIPYPLLHMIIPMPIPRHLRHPLLAGISRTTHNDLLVTLLIARSLGAG